jgi:1,4-alpha-glucan branching enzyme
MIESTNPAATTDDPGLAIDPAQAAALAAGAVRDPFALLGPHPDDRGVVVRAFLPGAESAAIIAADSGNPLAAMRRLDDAGLFAARLDRSQAYRLRVRWAGGVQETEDPYAFGLLLGELDLYLIGEGRHQQLWRCLGAQRMTLEDVPGVRFAVWAPNAQRASVIGDFNAWDGRRHAMRLRHQAGIWELFVPRLGEGERYKFEFRSAAGAVWQKADPMAQRAELPPATASMVPGAAEFEWHDDLWTQERLGRQRATAPVSIYELHAGSWQRNWAEGGRSLNWDELALRLVPYVAGLGFTHIELLPISEYPFGGSWGYQPLALFAPTGRYGSPDAFARFVDACHCAGVGVILDWVPAHFPADEHGLRRFDGTALYEHEDPREGFHQDWNTLIYNFGRREVAGFLIASALHWIERYHIDGLRVDAVASMLYRDYSRKPGEWIPNIYGGRENLEAIDFLRLLNDTVSARYPGTIVIAEESTSWPGVTQPVASGGLGFAYKWNMGWMNDTLRYIARDPVHRQHHHADITFGLLYAFSERFMLPLSHDEVVHLKGSLIARMPGDDPQRFANLRAYFGLMWGYPGKKLLFMGGEIAQRGEWNHDAELEWVSLEGHLHRGVQALVGDLNRVYRQEPALHAWDCDGRGFEWTVVDDRGNSVFAWLRRGPYGARPVLVVGNLTPVTRQGYRIGVPREGWWAELLNTDSALYGGGNVGNGGAILAVPTPCHGQTASLTLTLPPLATLILRYE